jgi:hypothetical protein
LHRRRLYLKYKCIIWNRIYNNKEISLIKSEDRYKDKEMVDLLNNGKLAMIEHYSDVFLLKAVYCKLDYKWKFHISEESFFQASLALGFRKDFDSLSVLKINSM